MNKGFLNKLRYKLFFGSRVAAALFFMIIGVLFWGGFNTALEQTNNMDFCISCHEMENNVYQEYRKTLHFQNPSGVRATCSDCHVPKEWHHMLIRKITATKELYHKLKGSIDTKEKFLKRRRYLAEKVWASMSETDSRECRNCHNFSAMDLAAQNSLSAYVHQYAQQKNKTCIDCHKGIAHQLPDDFIPYKGGDDDDHAFYKSQEIECVTCHTDMPTIKKEDWGF